MSLEGTLRVHQERLIHATGQAAALLLGVDDTTRTIGAAMGVIAQSVGADRASLLRLRRSTPAPTAAEVGAGSGAEKPPGPTLYFSTLHEWTRSDRLSFGALYQNVPVVGDGHDCTRWVKLLEAGRMLSIVGLDTLPPQERALVEAMPVRAMLRAPILKHGRLWGALGLDRADNERPWLDAEERVLRALADMVTALVLRGAFAPPAHGEAGA